jgi:Ulp1 protease family, C-terminal catalytic domain
LNLVTKGGEKKSLPFQSCSMGAKNLMTLQNFWSTFSFFNFPNNDILLNDKHRTLKEAKYVSCPQQENGCDCGLFALGNLLHAVIDLPIDESTFFQEHITLFRQQLHQILSVDITQHEIQNPMKSLSKYFMISFYPNLLDP